MLDIQHLPSSTPASNIVPELRTDWLTGRSVIVAENRALRPNEFAAGAGPSHVAGVPSCPFCVGNESATPPAVYEQLDERGQWRVRVVPNRFPAVTLAGDEEAAAPSVSSPVVLAAGAHEVIIESARHVDRMSALSVAELRDVLAAYAHRLRHWREDGRFAYGQVFKNQGPQAGASLAHLHSQLIALAAVPPAVEAEMRRAEDDYRRCRSCPYCRLVEGERSVGERVVLDRDGYLAFCPFASWQPHEMWLLPAQHEPAFEQMAPDALDRLADVLHALVGWLEPTVPHAAFNIMLRTAPWGGDCGDWCHWRIELLPRVNAIAGLEIATGLYINPTAPERAAAQLRPT